MGDPREELRQRLEARKARIARLERDDARFAAARLAVFALGAAAAALAFWGRTLSPAWLAVPAAAFLGLILLHDRTLRALTRARRASERRVTPHGVCGGAVGWRTFLACPIRPAGSRPP